MFKLSYLVATLVLLAVILTACVPGSAAAPASSIDTAAGSPTSIPVVAGSTAAVPTQEPASATGNGRSIFVVFVKGAGAGVFRFHGMDGSLRFEAPAPGLQYPDIYTTSVLKEAVYFSPNGIEKPIIRTSADGAKTLNLTVEKLSAFRVSPDEKWIAWSTFIGDTNPPSSQLWIGQIDGRGGVTDAKQIASYNLTQSQAFWLVPVQWSEDGTRLLFERSLTGLGGYIPFGGRFSMYGYDTASGQITTYISPEENQGMCLDSIRLDLNKVVFNCRQASQQVIVRDLSDSKETTIPALADQGVAGSANFSPSGHLLAYATARRNPDDEAGQVAVIAGDLSGEPKIIYKVDQQRYPMVQGWIDEDTLLITIVNNTASGNTVLTIKRDGTNVTQIATGFFVGWVK